MQEDAEYRQQLTAAVTETQRSSTQLTLISDLLVNVSCLRQCAPSLLRLLSQCVQIQVYAAGTEICRQGELAVGLMIVLQGTVAVTVSKRGRTSQIACIGALATIGEAALSHDIYCSSTLKALQETTLCVLSRTQYLSSLHAVTMQAQTARANFLHTTALFQPLSKQGVFRLAGYFREYKLQRGECCYQEGDLPLAVFIIVSGEVEFVKRHDPDFPSRNNSSNDPFPRSRSRLTSATLSLCLKGPGEMFGEEEVIANVNRENTARCATNRCVVLGIAKNDFAKQVQSAEIFHKLLGLEREKRQWSRQRFEGLKETEALKRSFTDRQVTPLPGRSTPVLSSSPLQPRKPLHFKSIFPTEVPESEYGRSKKVLLRPAPIVSSMRSKGERRAVSFDSPLLRSVLKPNYGSERMKNSALTGGRYGHSCSYVL